MEYKTYEGIMKKVIKDATEGLWNWSMSPHPYDEILAAVIHKVLNEDDEDKDTCCISYIFNHNIFTEEQIDELTYVLSGLFSMSVWDKDTIEWVCEKVHEQAQRGTRYACRNLLPDIYAIAQGEGEFSDEFRKYCQYRYEVDYLDKRDDVLSTHQELITADKQMKEAAMKLNLTDHQIPFYMGDEPIVKEINKVHNDLSDSNVMKAIQTFNDCYRRYVKAVNDFMRATIQINPRVNWKDCKMLGAYSEEWLAKRPYMQGEYDELP